MKETKKEGKGKGIRGWNQGFLGFQSKFVSKRKWHFRNVQANQLYLNENIISGSLLLQTKLFRNSKILQLHPLKGIERQTKPK
jgi:hypothetical protein